eukprot:CAMPEP_0171973660 /NCGR_PEP_ID=MMETSP0993-20121228/228647_1 /TAXON_ID=483369 /ORGANISM="non described non described, Strain CCMP2098" /LENGTH=267 /DNA_ID=CAMNT_0012624497 /DNA_START=39 /DNA_END=839 /DNA_ORIENTATION=+
MANLGLFLLCLATRVSSLASSFSIYTTIFNTQLAQRSRALLATSFVDYAALDYLEGVPVDEEKLPDLQRDPELREFNRAVHEASKANPEALDRMVLARLQAEGQHLTGSPILRPWVQDILKAKSLAEAASRVLARKICGAEAGLEMDVEVGGLNSRVDYLVPIFQSALNIKCPCLSLDLLAIVTKDPAATSYLQPFLFYKGFHASALQRIGHQFWVRSGDNAPVEALRGSPEGEVSASKREHVQRLEAAISGAEAHHTALWIQCRSS